MVMDDSRHATPRHRSVLLGEAVDAWLGDPSGYYVDCTCGEGGHAAALLARLSLDGRLLAMDQDLEAVLATRRRLAEDSRCQVVQASFADLRAVCDAARIAGQVHGVLFDLGVSSRQLDDPGRGFSFRLAGPLDMRMNPATGTSLADWLAVATEEDVARVLHEYGEERHARRIARAIVAARRRAPFRRTTDLSAVVSAALPSAAAGRHPATRAFQALRIHVNQELDALRAALSQCWSVIRPSGRLVAISFHSLEDRIVKRFIRHGATEPTPSGDVPDALTRRWQARGRIVRPTPEERRDNPRSRSAVMRVALRSPPEAHAEWRHGGGGLAC